MSEIQRRITDNLMSYWEKLKGDRLYPTLEEFNLNSPDLRGITDDVFLLKISVAAHDPQYHMLYIGANLRTLFARDGTGKYLHTMVFSFQEFLRDKYDEVYYSHAPFVEENEYGDEATSSIKYRQCLLPLGPDASTVNALVGGMRYKSSGELTNLLSEETRNIVHNEKAKPSKN